VLRSLRYDALDNEPGDKAAPALHHPPGVPMGGEVDILTLRVRDSAAEPIAVPATLASLRRIETAGANLRRFRLHTDAKHWYINGYNYHQDMQAIPIDIARDSIEVWEIRNDMQSMPHPMHLHGFQFQTLSRQNSPALRKLSQSASGVSAQDSGWSDTVLVWPGETVRIAIDFSHEFRGPQRYMFHCHNLEHEDQGMMMNMRVGG
jgi:FtsP/CotA-like multicopper oxidase with cupredoxin domain